MHLIENKTHIFIRKNYAIQRENNQTKKKE